VPGRRAAAPNPAGAHFLHDRALIGQLVRASGARRGSLVFDLGAGHGALTTALAAAGARVIAVERDHRLACGLRRRAAGNPLVRVVEDDLRQIPLPRQEFLVVANIPFSVTAALLRRLAGDPAVPLAGAELIISWGSARGLTSAVPRHAEAAWWAARYQMRIVRRVMPGCFTPPPRGDAAHLSIRPRPLAASPSGQRLLRRLLRAAYQSPHAPAQQVLSGQAAADRRLLTRGAVRRALTQAGADPRAGAATLTADQWHGLVMLLASCSGKRISPT
jgi:23S rRNA (adenine-N6)-dimethyltransferase